MAVGATRTGTVAPPVWGRALRILAAPPGDLTVTAPAFEPNPAAAALGYTLRRDESGLDTGGGLLTGRWAPRAAGEPPVFARSVPVPVPRAQAMLAVGFLGGVLEGLAATSPRGFPCCSVVQTVALSRRGVSRRARTLVKGLAGPAVAALVPLPGSGRVAAVAAATGVWVADGGRHGFSGPRRLDGPSASPRALTTAPLRPGDALIAFTGTGSGTVAPVAVPRLLVATATAHGSTRARVVLSAPAGYEFGDLSAVPYQGGAMLAFTESWYDTEGRYHSRVQVVELHGARLRPGRVVPVSGAQALSDAGSLAAGPGGEVIAWRACPSASVTCTAEDAKLSRTGWSRPAALGALDAGAAPAVAETTLGTVLLARVSHGRVLISAAPKGSRRPVRPVVLSPRGSQAGEVGLAAGPAGSALATWTQGGPRMSLYAALYG